MVSFLRRKSLPTRRKIGRRGAMLLLLGVIYVVVGGSLIGLPNTDPAVMNYSLQVYLTGSLGFWGGAYITVGVVSAITAFWPTGRDAWGYAALVFFTTSWATMCFLSTAFFDSPRAWVVGVIWSAFSGVLMIASGMRGVNES